MNHPKLADSNTCTGCMACVDSCPTRALTHTWNDEGHLSYVCNTEKCVLCHQCEKTCPVVSHFEYRCDGPSTYLAAWCLKDEVRRKSSSGGAFAAIAGYVLSKGGYVIGASNEGVCDIRHVVINDVADLYKLQGSKYTQSDASGIYKQTLALLKEGKTVLFSGTGCQVAGILSFLSPKKYTGSLITIDLVCGGIPSRFLIEKFLDGEPYKIKKIVSFRSKTKGWKSKDFSYNLLTEDERGEFHDYTGVKNLIIDGFSREMTERYSCYNCQFNGSSRKSDFTIGDLWGDEQYKKQHEKGLSLVIVHNPDALALIKSLNDWLEIAPTNKKEAIAHNFRIINGYNIRQFLWERKHLSFLFSHLPYKSLKRIYANDISKFSPWMLYKIWRKIRIEILKHTKGRYTKRDYNFAKNNMSF